MIPPSMKVATCGKWNILCIEKVMSIKRMNIGKPKKRARALIRLHCFSVSCSVVSFLLFMLQFSSNERQGDGSLSH